MTKMPSDKNSSVSKIEDKCSENGSASRGRIIQWEDIALPEIPDVNYASLMLQIFESQGDKIALVDASSEKNYTYRQLRDLVFKMKDTLALTGVSLGSAVIVVSNNHIDFPAAILSIMLLGATCVPVNTDLTVGELAHVARVSKAKWAMVNERAAEKVKAAFNSLGSDSLHQFWIFGGTTGTHLTVGDSNKALPAKSTPETNNFNANETVALMPFSSGTTGLPKGVMLSHRNLTAAYAQNVFLRSINPNGNFNVYASTLLVLPMYHMYGYNMTMATLMNGGQLVLLMRFSPKNYFEAIQKYKVTFAPIVPYIIKMLLESPIMEKYDLSSLVSFVTGSAPIAEATLDNLTHKSGKFTVQGYGLTESCGIGTFTKGIPGSDPNTVGQVGPFFQAKVIDVETGQMLGEREGGELCLRGPSIMLGYANNPKATAETIDSEGWLHTGDLAYYDEENFIYITDRIKDLIKVKGYQVAPTELENLIQKLENVSEVAVVGVPNERFGEVPRAWIVPVPGTTIDKMAVIKYVAENVAPYKQLAGGVEIVKSIPKNHIGKILRRDLKKTFTTPVSKL